MPDVYVEPGTAKFTKSISNLSNTYGTPAQKGLESGVINAVRKTNSGMTTAKPSDGKGIQVGVFLTKLAQEDDKVSCAVIGELFELPGKGRFTGASNASGQASVPGKIGAVAADCVAKAVGDMMGKITSGIVASQNAPASTGGTNTSNATSPLIFITFDVTYPSTFPKDLEARATAAMTAGLDKKFKANTQRFTLNPNAFKRGSGMPAYQIGMTLETLKFDAGSGEFVIETRGYIAEHPSRNMIVLRVGSRSKMSGYTREPRQQDKATAIQDATESTADKVIQIILQRTPDPRWSSCPLSPPAIRSAPELTIKGRLHGDRNDTAVTTTRAAPSPVKGERPCPASMWKLETPSS